MAERIVKKTKQLTCSHSQTFSTPVPQPGDAVWCLTCEAPSYIPKLKRTRTIATGRPSRAKTDPKGNNQFTKGRKING